jgi:glycosyltransferase involved in cell wall biosynthesis
VSKISRHLFEQGWDVRVLCGRQDDVPEGLPVELPRERIVRTGFFDVNAIPKMLLGRGHVVRRGFEFNQRGGVVTALGRAYRNVVNFPDGQIGWYRPAVKAGAEMIRRERPDVILAVATPWTSHLVASALSRRFNIPWVARYHDLWADSRARGRVWPLSELERALEDRNTGTATAIVTMADTWRDELAGRFPSKLVATVPFGFEPADYPPIPPPSGLPLSLLYTGRLYDRQDPAKLFAAVRDMLATGRIAPADIRIRFIGRYLAVARRALARFNLPPDVVRIDDPVPHAEVMALQQRASALVVFMSEDDDVGLLPAKMYGYLGARRPVLVVGGSERHEGVTILRRARVGTWAEGPEEIAAVLSGWVAHLRTGPLTVEPDLAVVKAHEWSAAAAAMGDVLRASIERSKKDAA